MMRRFKPLVQAYKTTMRPNVTQKRFQSSLQVLADSPKLTTDYVVGELDQLFEKNDYVSRYPQMSFEDYEEVLEKELSKEFVFNERMVDLVHRALGFPKEEVEYGFARKLPDLYTPNANGSFTINWKTITEIYCRTDKESTRIDDLEKFFKNLEALELSIVQEASEDKDINWGEWESRLGAHTVKEVRKQFKEIFESTKPVIDLDRVEKAFDRQMQPILDFVKDDLIDHLPLVKQYAEELTTDSNLLKTDEYGMPIYNFDSPAFLDEYYPKERDEMILEIEDDDWDPHYTAIKKKLRISPDELVEYSKDWVVNESLKQEDMASIRIEGGAGLSPQKREEEQIFKDVMEIGKKNKVLESEVSTLRLQKEFEAEENKSKEGEKKKEEAGGEEVFKESDWEKFIESLGAADESLRDFKHMSREEIIEWTKKDQEIRGEAESELLRVQKGGKL